VSRYLTLIPYLVAQQILKQTAKPRFIVKSVPVTESLGHLAHEPVFSRLNVPCCAVSLRDGYAVISDETLSASESNPVQLNHYSWVHTGSPVPDGFDSVIMQEDIRMDNAAIVSIIKPARPGQHIQKAGSEITTGKMIIPAGHCITPEDIGAMIGYGITAVQVKTVIAGLIPTGDELREPCVAPGPGEVIASNSPMIAAFLKERGISSISYDIVPDDPKKIRNAIEDFVQECSFIIITGGSSSGIRDHTSRVLKSMGSMLYHGVAIRPGKSTLAAIVEDIPVFGLPGTPGGSLGVLRELIIPWLSETGYPIPKSRTLTATLAESIASDLGTDDFVQLVVGKVNNNYCAALVPRGNGQMASVKTNGILYIPRNSEGLKENREVLIELTRTYPHPDNILLFSGYTDVIIDYLDQYLRVHQMKLYARKTSFETTILSMQNRNFHGGVIARPHIEGRYLPFDHSLVSEPVCSVHVAERQYILGGIGNFESEMTGIETCPSLPEKSFLSVFMEEYFISHQIKTTTVKHMSPVCLSEEDVIQKIRDGTVDAGPCSLCLASDYDLCGPVIGSMSIDLIFREEDVESDQIKRVREFLLSDEWKDMVDTIPGYSSGRSGQTDSFP